MAFDLQKCTYLREYVLDDTPTHPSIQSPFLFGTVQAALTQLKLCAVVRVRLGDGSPFPKASKCAVLPQSDPVHHASSAFIDTKVTPQLILNSSRRREEKRPTNMEELRERI